MPDRRARPRSLLPLERLRGWSAHFRHGTRAFRPHVALRAVQAFVATESAGGAALFLASALALLWANLAFESYAGLWGRHLSISSPLFAIDEDLRHWINDGLMAFFFFLAGLEIKREAVHGELRTLRQARLPLIAAAGGMALPAAIYLAFNPGGPAADGWGIPMATDIAFALGVLALAGSRVPFGLKVFVLALAVIDDVGSIVIIALFYSTSIDAQALALALGLVVLCLGLGWAGVRSLAVYAAVAIALWLSLHEAGVAPTLAGVVIGLLTPASPEYSGDAFAATGPQLFDAVASSAAPDERQDALDQIDKLVRGSEAPLERLERAFHPWVSFGVLPLFALANAGVHVTSGLINAGLGSPVFAGIIVARLAGKPAGIFLATFIAVSAGICDLPAGTGWRHIFGAGLAAAVGFTVSLLVADRAFDATQLTDFSKLALLGASIVAAVAAYVFMRLFWARPVGRGA